MKHRENAFRRRTASRQIGLSPVERSRRSAWIVIPPHAATLTLTTDRVFLDANVPFSTACLWRSGFGHLRISFASAPPSRLRMLDEISTRLINVRASIVFFTALKSSMSRHANARIPASVRLASKEVPILLAAIHHPCTHLLTALHERFLFRVFVSSWLLMHAADGFSGSPLTASAVAR